MENSSRVVHLGPTYVVVGWNMYRELVSKETGEVLCIERSYPAYTVHRTFDEKKECILECYNP